MRNGATAAAAFAFPGQPDKAIGLVQFGFEAAGEGIQVEVAEALPAQGGGITDGPVGLAIGTGANGDRSSKNSCQLPDVSQDNRATSCAASRSG